MSEERSETNWDGEFTAVIRPFTAAQVWQLLADGFCSLDKWAPNIIDTCYRVEGEPGRPGLTRYCANSATSLWANEKLIEIDPRKMYFSYEVMDNNIGLRSYVAKIKVSSVIDGGCKIEWSFESEPAEGKKLEDFRVYIQTLLDAMVHNMVAALLKSHENA